MRIYCSMDSDWHVKYAHEYIQNLYDHLLMTGNASSSRLDAIEYWPVICDCYTGIEQTMKLLLQKNGQTPKKTHDLECLYQELQCSQWSVINEYYRVYQSLYSHELCSIPLDAADKFISHINKGYASWRYILIEKDQEIPAVNVGFMLEVWRALVRLVSEYNPPRLDQRVKIYFQEFFEKAERDLWRGLGEYPEEYRGVAPDAIRTWVKQQGGDMTAGFLLFKYNHSGEIRDTSTVVQKILDQSVKSAIERLHSTNEHSPGRKTWRRQEMLDVYSAIHSKGLTWDENREAFEYISP